ncbi:adenine phosphoribosyltransferase [Arthrobacter sp. zg-Y820]|uniref:adenine phosphoribosyltransferase n=1 Tax=unclassified Arthrobacter TaxID=235627 RepID=UPI00254252D7|nr:MULTISPECIES: adenine phosphoribosyltransferase [unclassified Arthrobacter]MCC9198241.1 adenine phosphoribosyltransferase [Arthrobacter sp. zg-Y820]MDK1281110.1 adenine phosphoribosyltransferase [Arthrobacter sp. zg.Y820]MDK1360428.1 adenine phosphoribosyltransferase [Arthrobacter sp. zg-Y1219]WIB10568.1 adenine phosphoribosyltransferase [Arthrobacter sp. zg-Y820]
MKDAPAEPVNNETIEQTIERLGAVVPDYPKPGVVFRDLTPVFADGQAFRSVVDSLLAEYEGRFDYVAGVEARGFLLAAAAAYAADKGVITIRKPGKLPRRVHSESFSMEYGENTLEVHQDDIPVGARVLILDDVLATGGTLGATARLIEKAGAVVAGFGVVLELKDLGGRQALAGYPVHALIGY